MGVLMKVFQIIDSNSFGGIESHILHLSKYLKANDVDNCVLFTHHYENNEFRKLIVKEKIPFLEGNVGAFIKSNPNAIFHSHGYKANIINKLYKTFYRHKAICSNHSGELGSGAFFFYNLFDKKTAFIPNLSIAVSQKIQDDLLGTNNQTLYNFIYEDAKPNTKKEIENISFVGRLSEEKNPEAFVKLAILFKEFNYNVFGDGELKSIVVNDFVKFHGYTSDQELIWDNTDILFISSLYEGLPYTLIEALSRGKIVISFKVGEIPNIIENNKNGFLVNDLREAYHLLELIKSGKLNTELIQENAINTFNELFGKKAGKPFLDVYKQLL